MTARYWYAIVARPAEGVLAPARWGAGLRSQPLAVVEADGLAAIVSAWEGAPVGRAAETVDPDLVLQHERVIEAIMAEQPLLPMRFGTVLADEERIRKILSERYLTFVGDLERVGNCVEMGVRVLWPGTPAVAAAVEATPAGLTPGTQYLHRRVAEAQQQRLARSHGQEVAGRLDRALRTAALEARTSVLPTERMLLSAAYLVTRDQVAAFLAQVEALRRAHAEMAFLCTGPWPPYNFMSGA